MIFNSILLATLALTQQPVTAATPQPAPITEPVAAPAAPAETPPAPNHEAAGLVELAWHGYGELHFAYRNYGANQNRANGAPKENRLTFDTTRLALEAEIEFPHEVEVEAEIEFEHGGTGAEMELEYEEFGEYEAEIEKGGEVIIEELYVKKEFGEKLAVRLGRFYVAVGLMPDYHEPTDFLGTIRPEAESVILPSLWDEMGLQLDYRPAEKLHLRAQIVNGLDSTGFSSHRWIAGGEQGRFAEIRATDLAYVGRADMTPADGLLVGSSVYYGDSSRNRPKADLAKACAKTSPDVTAPCGVVAAPVFIADGHVRFERGRALLSGAVVYGNLAHADAVSDRNSRLSNNLNVLRTPVAEEALAFWAEAGYDVAPALGLSRAHALFPFVRYDWYDSMYGTRSNLFDNPRFQRKLVTTGLSYRLEDAITLKADWSQRRFASARMRPESTVTLATGFVF